MHISFATGIYLSLDGRPMVDDVVPEGLQLLDEVLLEVVGRMVGGNVNTHADSVSHSPGPRRPIR